MGDGCEQFLAKAATITVVVALGEHVGKIKGKHTVIDIEPIRQPGEGIQQIKQVAVIPPYPVGPDGVHQKARAEGATAEFDGIHMIEIEINVLRTNEG